MAHIAALCTHPAHPHQSPFASDVSPSSHPPAFADQAPITPILPSASISIEPSVADPPPTRDYVANANVLPTVEEDEEKRCWICHGDETDSEGRWVKPCKCSLICHEEC